MDEKLIDRIVQMITSNDNELHRLGWTIFFSHDQHSADHYVSIIKKMRMKDSDDYFNKQYYDMHHEEWKKTYANKEVEL